MKFPDHIPEAYQKSYELYVRLCLAVVEYNGPAAEVVLSEAAKSEMGVAGVLMAASIEQVQYLRDELDSPDLIAQHLSSILAATPAQR